ncbi:MAG: DMT family transporter [Verrucomicrobiota bacterium]
MPALLLILACALWAVSFPLVKVLHLEQSARLTGASTLFLASWMQFARFGLGALMLLPFVFGKSRPTPNEIRQGLIIAFWGGFGMWIQADALAYTEASTSAFLTQAYCIFLPLWACIRTRRSPGIKVTLATIMVLAGGAILSGIRPDHFHLGRGEIETLLAAFLFTFQILSLENPRYERNRGIPVSFVMFLGIAALFIPVTAITAPDLRSCLTAGASIESFVLVASLALFCSVGAYVLMNVWQPRVSATEAGLIYTIEPVFTAVYVLFLPVVLGRFVGENYPNEVITTQLVSGGSLILAANALMQWKKKPHLPPAGPVE